MARILHCTAGLLLLARPDWPDLTSHVHAFPPRGAAGHPEFWGREPSVFLPGM